MKNNTQTLIPPLRFPEFKGEWEKIKLDNLLDFKNGINASKEDYGFGYKFINVLDIIENDFITYDKIKGEVNVPKKVFEKNLVQYGDILFQRSSETREEVGQSNVYLDKENKATFGGFVIRGKKIGNYEPFFFHLLLKSSIARKEITTKSGGSTRYNVGQDILSSIKLPFPKIQEQQKIANFLTAVNNRIQNLEKKKSLLEEYKKGVMQKIFKQELRFKDTSTALSAGDGKAFPEWEFKNGNLLLQSISDKNHNSDLPILAVTQDQGAIPRHLIDYNIGVTAKSVSSYKVVQVGDFIISLRSFQGGIEYSSYKGICSPAYIILRPIKDMNRDFYKYYLKTPSYIKELTRKLEGIRDGKMISYKYFSEIKLPYPALEEQTKIANFLSAIDKNIALVKDQIEKTKAYKKGLLQQLFV
ncbi:restriction endonuclease subunit S [Ascidiimonas sp. W6]|uniref:restriction endonuclease subunit S n=1 Tax=Ascidiimonas meishanensis TaxID=3128903 RepID=UPI0030EF6074